MLGGLSSSRCERPPKKMPLPLRMIAVLNLMLTRFFKIIGLLLIGATGSLKAQVEITVEAGHMVAQELRDYMPGLAGSLVGQQVAERIGDITLTGTREITGVDPVTMHPTVVGEVVSGANYSGSISATVQVANTGTYTGTFTAGVQGVLSGAVGSTLGQTVTGTHNMSIWWNVGIDPDGSLRIIYVISVGQETRNGDFKIAVHKRHLHPEQETPAEPQPSEFPTTTDYQGDYFIWYRNILPWDIPRPRGSVIIHELNILEWWAT